MLFHFRLVLVAEDGDVSSANLTLSVQRVCLDTFLYQPMGVIIVTNVSFEIYRGDRKYFHVVTG
jgi:hypothetical protein